MVSGVPGLFSVPDTHVGQAQPSAFNLFLIKSIIDAHKSVFSFFYEVVSVALSLASRVSRSWIGGKAAMLTRKRVKNTVRPSTL